MYVHKHTLTQQQQQILFMISFIQHKYMMKKKTTEIFEITHTEKHTLMIQHDCQRCDELKGKRKQKMILNNY